MWGKIIAQAAYAIFDFLYLGNKTVYVYVNANLYCHYLVDQIVTWMLVSNTYKQTIWNTTENTWRVSGVSIQHALCGEGGFGWIFHKKISELLWAGNPPFPWNSPLMGSLTQRNSFRIPSSSKVTVINLCFLSCFAEPMVFHQTGVRSVPLLFGPFSSIFVLLYVKNMKHWIFPRGNLWTLNL